MIRPISLGTRFLSAAPPFCELGAVDSPAVLAVELRSLPCVVEFGPVTTPAVSDVGARWPGATGTALLLLAAEAEFAPPLQAVTRIIETRIFRYIFPRFGKR